MKTIMNKGLALLLAVSALFSCASAVTPDISTRAMEQIIRTSCGIGIADDGLATMSGSTAGDTNSTKVTVAMYLERQKTGGWSTVPGMSWTASTTTSVTIALNKSYYVDRGWNYRLRVEHSATGPNGTETRTSYSSAYEYK